MPFIRQSRDKRGFEHTYVMHTGRPGSGPPRPKVLYVFRSPGNLRVGRKPLDAEVREALEHTHPDVSFDWNALTREAVVTRAEPAPPRPQRPAKSRPASPPPPEPSPAAPHAEDLSLLGRTLGAGLAARLRGRFGEISQRIAQRSRTPEERNALFDKARLLNPDSWLDEAAIRAHATTIDADLDRIASELPSRRRGRRGGRNRHEQPRETGGAGQSGIMTKGDERHEDFHDASLDRPDSPPDTGGGAGVGSADAEADLSSDD